MSRFFSQGDLVRIISKKIPSSGGVQSRDRFPHGIGIVTNIKNYEASENRIYLIPIHDKKIEELTKVNILNG